MVGLCLLLTCSIHSGCSQELCSKPGGVFDCVLLVANQGSPQWYDRNNVSSESTLTHHAIVTGGTGNILIDAEGHIIHIDFGFLFTTSPGGNMNFEAAPFKLTSEYVAVLGGPRSRLFGEYRALCATAFLAARRHAGKIILLVEMMLSGAFLVGCGLWLCFVGFACGSLLVLCWCAQATTSCLAFEEATARL